MTMNTKEMYLILNEDNFFKIINEKTKEGKIKLFLDIIEEKNENLIETMSEDFLSRISKKFNIDYDLNKKLSLSVSNEHNINKNEILQANSTQLSSYKSENNDELNLNILKPKKSLNIQNDKNIEKSNKINNYLIESKKKQFNIIENKNIIELVEICSICKKIIKDKIKYECCLCDKCTLCQNCENFHEHPCIKFKISKSELFTLKDCQYFMYQKQNFSGMEPIRYFKNLFNNFFDIILQLEIDNHIEIRPNKIIDIPILIKNYSDYPVSSTDFF